MEDKHIYLHSRMLGIVELVQLVLELHVVVVQLVFLIADGLVLEFPFLPAHAPCFLHLGYQLRTR